MSFYKWLIAAAAACGLSAAIAQTPGSFISGSTLPATQLNSALGGKQDYHVEDIWFDNSLTRAQISAVRAGTAGSCTTSFDSSPILKSLEARTSASGPNGGRGNFGTPGPRVHFGGGCYPFAAAYSVTHAVTLIGVGPGGVAGGSTQSTFFGFPRNSAGLYFDNQCTSFGVSITCTSGPQGANSSSGARIENIRIDGNTSISQSNGVNPGVYLATPITLQNFGISNFDGTCLQIAGNTSNSLSDGWMASNGSIFNCGAYGVLTAGGDANVGLMQNVRVGNTVGSCINNEAFLSNTFVNTNTADCDGYAWFATINSGYTSIVSANPVASFTGSISGGVLTASSVTGTIPVPSTPAGASFNGVTITSQLTGPAGGAGKYQVSNGSISISSEAMTVPHIFQCISVNACGTTAPINGSYINAAWYDLGTNFGAAAPAWLKNYTKYLVGGPYASLNPNSESVFIGTYCEGNGTGSAIAPQSIMVGGQQCPLAFANWFTSSSFITGNTFQATNGWSVVSPKLLTGPCGSAYVSAGIGGYFLNGFQSGTTVGWEMGNSCDMGTSGNVAFEWAWEFSFPNYTDLCLYLGVNVGFQVFCGTGVTTANTFGTGATATTPIPYFPMGVAFSDGSSGRLVKQGSAAPTSGLHAQGEIVFNNAWSGLSAPFAWINTVTGTPGTWVPLVVSQSGTSTVSGLPTCNTASKGTRYFVTDLKQTVTYHSTVTTGGGSTNLGVTCDGTNWYMD